MCESNDNHTICGEPMAPKYEAGSRLTLHDKCRANITRHIIKYGLTKDIVMRNHLDELKQTLFITNKPANYDARVMKTITTCLKSDVAKLLHLGVSEKTSDPSGSRVTYHDWAKGFLHPAWDGKSLDEGTGRRLLQDLASEHAPVDLANNGDDQDVVHELDYNPPVPSPQTLCMPGAIQENSLPPNPLRDFLQSRLGTPSQQQHTIPSTTPTPAVSREVDMGGVHDPQPHYPSPNHFQSGIDMLPLAMDKLRLDPLDTYARDLEQRERQLAQQQARYDEEQRRLLESRVEQRTRELEAQEAQLQQREEHLRQEQRRREEERVQEEWTLQREEARAYHEARDREDRQRKICDDERLRLEEQVREKEAAEHRRRVETQGQEEAEQRVRAEKLASLAAREEALHRTEAELQANQPQTEHDTYRSRPQTPVQGLFPPTPPATQSTTRVKDALSNPVQPSDSCSQSGPEGVDEARSILHQQRACSQQLVDVVGSLVTLEQQYILAVAAGHAKRADEIKGLGCNALRERSLLLDDLRDFNRRLDESFAVVYGVRDRRGYEATGVLWDVFVKPYDVFSQG